MLKGIGSKYVSVKLRLGGFSLKFDVVEFAVH
jgi:hypothetical protein